MIQRINANYNTYSYRNNVVKNNNNTSSNIQNIENQASKVSFKGIWEDIFGIGEKTINDQMNPEVEKLLDYAYDSIKNAGLNSISGQYNGKNVKLSIHKDNLDVTIENTNSDPEFSRKFIGNELFIRTCGGFISTQNQCNFMMRNDEPLRKYEETICEYLPPILYQNYML